MTYHIRKPITILLLLTMLMSVALSNVSYAAGSIATEIADITESDIPSSEGTPDLIQDVTPELPKITYGPYRGNDIDQKHAYEPFRANEEQRELEDLAGFSYKQDRILVKLKKSSVEQRGFTSSSSVSSSLLDYGIIDLTPLNIPVKKTAGARGFQSMQSPTDDGTWYKALISEGTDVIDTIQSVSSLSGVLLAEPDYLRKVEDLGIPDITTDPLMVDQWFLEQLGIKQAWDHLQEQGIEAGGSKRAIGSNIRWEVILEAG